MSLEEITSGAGHTIADLVASNPAAGDDVAQGDDHLRAIKHALHLTWPALDATVCGTPAEMMLGHKGGSISGALFVKDTLTVGSNAVLGGTMGLASNLSVGGSLSVDGATTFNANVTVSAALVVTGALTLGGGLDSGGTLTAAGNCSIGGNLNVNGTLTAGGNASVGGNLSVAGALKAGSLTVGGAVAMGNTLNVVSNAVIGGSMTVASNAVVEGTLSAVGATHLDSTLTVVGNSIHKSGVSVGGNVIAAGALTCTNVNPSGYVAVGSWLNCAGTFTVGGAMVSYGKATFEDDVSISGVLQVLGAVTFAAGANQVNFTNLDVANTISGSCLQAAYARSAGAINSSLVFSSTTRVIFQQTTPPSGWSKETNGSYNDLGLRLTTGTVGAPTGATSFTSLFTSSRATDSQGSHQHAAAGDHAHGGTLTTGGPSTDHAVGGTGSYAAGSGHTHNVTILTANTHQHAATGAHTHNTNLQLKYTDVVIGKRI